jgi:hypothetical protein
VSKSGYKETSAVCYERSSKSNESALGVTVCIIVQRPVSKPGPITHAYLFLIVATHRYLVKKFIGHSYSICHE